MISFELVTDQTLPLLINEQIQAAPRKMRKELREIVRWVKVELIDKRLAVEPRPARAKLRTKSARQDRKLWALWRERGGVPYARGTSGSGGLLERFTIDYSEGEIEGTITISNRAPASIFVIGDWAQPFHLDTGWTQMANVVSEFRPVTEQKVGDAWFKVAGGFNG